MAGVAGERWREGGRGRRRMVGERRSFFARSLTRSSCWLLRRGEEAGQKVEEAHAAVERSTSEAKRCGFSTTARFSFVRSPACVMCRVGYCTRAGSD